ncbi:VOC family protein [Paenibacillus segetis]|uniref:Glyoxalase/bleomycin resistance/dioxygenase family protein n=1 Tax=Paenibacillus segetis TaxID=1325360 RepID=A0ABQ1YJ64_9BACL|nr:VOC family protein [Paenibacillus segetis]GGH27302.1 glyoxalase/bleomycin resistance/dioxygenase family protein [Paenibacillus segetis]
MKFSAVGFFVEDLENMVKFYRDVMKMDTDWDGGPFARFQTEGSWFMMFGRKDFEDMTIQTFDYPKGLNGTMELAFDVPNFSDVDKEYERLIQSGAKSVLQPLTKSWGQRVCYVADPEGNLLEICSFGVML